MSSYPPREESKAPYVRKQKKKNLKRKLRTYMNPVSNLVREIQKPLKPS